MHKFLSGLVAGVALLIAAPSALAAPVTVDLRIEGPTRTLFEGPVTTDVRTFQFTGDAVVHRCDGTAAENHGTSPTPVPTRGAAVAAAAEQMPFAMHGTWPASIGSPQFTDIGGENVAFDGTSRFLAEYKNAEFAGVGACGDPIGPGDDVLFAYTDGSEPLLALTGPASATPGGTAIVKVTGASGAAIAGATVGGATTAADGRATVGPFTQRGDQDLKASKPGTVRSNRLRVCVSDGHDGSCDTTTPGATPGAPAAARDTTAPTATVAALRNGAVYSRRRAPRLLRGKVAADPSGLRSVKLKLTRRVGKHCSYFSGRRERFVPMRCGRGSFLRIGDSADWSYLLPKRLGRGRYVLEVKAVDGAFNRGAPARVRFRVK